MAYFLRCGLWLPLGRAEVFRFFEDAGNLPRITPGWLGFRIESGEVAIKEGSLIDYTVRWGVRLKWRTEIAVYRPPYEFVDRQVRGPYALWRHRHLFVEEVRGGVRGTRVEDEVAYRLPLGVLGRVVHWGVVGGNLRGIFEYRQRETAGILLGGRAGEAEIGEVRMGWERGK